jgi:hypothetical protein
VPSLRPASSINTENSATRRVLANRVLFYDQRCFLTGSVSPETQACHLINTIRPKGKERKKRLKEQIVRARPLKYEQCLIILNRSLS